MKANLFLTIMVIAMCNALTAESVDRVLLDLRVLVENDHPIMQTTLRNPHQEFTVRFDGSYYNLNFNHFAMRHLDADGRRFGRETRMGEIATGICREEGRRVRARTGPLIEVSPASSYTKTIDMMSNIRSAYYASLIGKYHILRWSVSPWRSNVKGASSQPVYLAVSDADGNIGSPVVDPRDPTANTKLALVFNENQPNEMGFLFFNGTDEDVAVERPLTEASRIVAISPAIDYTRELFLADQTSEMIEIEAGQVGEWRIPWPTIRDLIPEADLATIKESGGDLDLVWKVGDFQSDPLPLSLSDPPNNDDKRR